MAGYQQSFEARERPIYYYRLNENYTGVEPIKIETIKLVKVWTGFDKKQEVLDLYLRTYRNPSGILDLKIEDLNKKVYGNAEVDFTKKKIVHSRDVLCTYKRVVLADIARQWNIDPVNKRDVFLIDLICEKQKEYQDYKEEEKRLKKGDSVEPIPEEVVE